MKFMKLQLIVFALFLLAASSAFADTILSVSVDTQDLAGQNGYLYFAYIPVNAADSSAVVSNFIGGTLSPTASANVVDGTAVSGVLPGPVTFVNTNGINDYNHGILFGDSLSFLLTLIDPTAGGQEGGISTFSLSLFANEEGTIPLGGGTLFTSDLGNDGMVNTSVLSEIASVSQVPEAGTMWLLGSGLLGLLFTARSNRNKTA
jgi:hypothetical protein